MATAWDKWWTLLSRDFLCVYMGMMLDLRRYSDPRTPCPRGTWVLSRREGQGTNKSSRSCCIVMSAREHMAQVLWEGDERLLSSGSQGGPVWRGGFWAKSGVTSRQLCNLRGEHPEQRGQSVQKHQVGNELGEFQEQQGRGQQWETRSESWAEASLRKA